MHINSDSIYYIKSLMIKSIEALPIFKSLHPLEIIRFSNAKEFFPDVNTKKEEKIYKLLKSYRTLTFEISSSHIWLEFQLDFRDIASVFFFQIKLSQDSTISDIKQLIAKILNNLLKEHGMPATYVDSQILIRKLKLSSEAKEFGDINGCQLSQNSIIKSTKDLHNTSRVKQAFNYINRQIFCMPPSNRVVFNKKQRRSAIRKLYAPTLLGLLQNMAFGIETRAVRVENKIIANNQKHDSHALKRKNEIQEHKHENCKCRIF